MKEPAGRQSSATVLAVAVGLAAIAGAAVSLFRPGVTELDGPTLLAERFDVRAEPPFGLAVGEALRMANGEVHVVLAGPGSDAEDPPLPELDVAPDAAPDPAGDPAPAPPAGPPGPPRTDWSKVPVGPEGSPPVEAAFVWYPRGTGEAVLRRQFAETRFRDVEHLFGEQEDMAVEMGEIEWGPYWASYVRTRHFRKVEGRPTFHETVRVNLSRGRSACVLYVRWGRGLPGSVEGAKAVLAAYGPSQESR